MKYLMGTQCIYIDETPSLKKYARGGTGKMAQTLRVLAAFQQVAGFIPRTHTESQDMMQAKHSYI